MRNPRFHAGFRGFRYSITANVLRDRDSDELKGPGLERGGLGGADVEGASFTQTDFGLRQRREAFHEAVEGLQG
jgi:hypothetical protein